MTNQLLAFGIRRGLAARFAIVLFAATGLLTLTGCAGAKLSNLAVAPAQSQAPSALVVAVSVAPDLAGEPEALRAADELGKRLVKRYTKAGIQASSGAAIRLPRDVARLSVVVGRAEAGDWFRRFAIGFGAGRSVLHASASLQVQGANRPILNFSSRADSGRMPGFILSGGVAAATSDAANVAINGGLGLVSSSRDGLSRNADRTAKLIVKQTRLYYRRSGWLWPDQASRAKEG